MSRPFFRQYADSTQTSPVSRFPNERLEGACGSHWVFGVHDGKGQGRRGERCFLCLLQKHSVLQTNVSQFRPSSHDPLFPAPFLCEKLTLAPASRPLPQALRSMRPQGPCHCSLPSLKQKGHKLLHITPFLELQALSWLLNCRAP